MLRVGLTGNIASGKSAVAEVWRRRGARVIDADELARAAIAPGTAGYDRAVAVFGPDIVMEDGTIDRGALRDIVFRDAARRETLESILHPEIERLRTEGEAALEATGTRVVVHMIPLLYEVGMDDAFDAVVLVDAPASVRLARLMDRGLGADEAQRMMDAQMPPEDKRSRADHVIDNAGTLEELESAASDVWRRITAGI